MLSVVLIVFALNSWFANQLHKDLLSEVLYINLDATIDALEDINIELMDIYLKEKVDESVQINTHAFDEMDLISDEVDELLGIEHQAMRWYRLGSIEWTIKELKYKESLSPSDMEYILDYHRINQELLNAYNDILISYNVDKYRYSNKKKYVSDIYKDFSIKGSKIISSESFETLYDFEPILNEEELAEFESKITQGEAEKIANALYLELTGEIANFEIEERSEFYEFKEDWNINSKKDNYEITIYKDTLEVDVHLSAWGGEGQFSEAKIDESAKKYITQFVPEDHVVVHKDIRIDENRIDSITYTLIKFDGKYYNGQNEIRLKVDNQGKLRSYNYCLMGSNKKIGDIVDEEEITNQINLGTIESVILVLNDKDVFEYQVRLKLNNTTYILSFDALTGEQTAIFNSDRFYGNRASL